jgi:hypothetical protein
MFVPGGKIMVYTGFRHHFKTDAEVAAVLGHEVCTSRFYSSGSYVIWGGSKLKSSLAKCFSVRARHTAEAASKSLVSMFMRTGIRQFFDNPSLVKYVSKLLLELPLSRRYVLTSAFHIVHDDVYIF